MFIKENSFLLEFVLVNAGSEKSFYLFTANLALKHFQSLTLVQTIMHTDTQTGS